MLRGKYRAAVFFSMINRNGIFPVLKILLGMILLGMTVVAASFCFAASQSRAADVNAPWCIINSEGDLHCYYASSQACLHEIAGGSRGFCVQNPAGSSAAAAEPRPSRRKTK
jgi:hypothetical protein